MTTEFAVVVLIKVTLALSLAFAIPGLGDVNWGAMFSALTDAGYTGPVCVEVEDRAFEKTLADRKRSLALSRQYLQAYVG